MIYSVCSWLFDRCRQHSTRFDCFSAVEQHQCLSSRRKLRRTNYLKSTTSVLLLTTTLLTQSSAFSGSYGVSRPRHFLRMKRLEQYLMPLSHFERDLTFFFGDKDYRLCIDEQGHFTEGDDKFELYLIEEDDLPDLSRFVVAAFGAEAISLSKDLNAFEKALISPAAAMLNSYSSIVAFAEVFSGTKQRLGSRLDKMDISVPNIEGLSNTEAIAAAEKDSLVLALARPSQDTESRIEVIASIELRLQPCDAKIPFSLPWLDKVERSLASTIGLGDGAQRDLQPYLSNLCVDERFRGKRIGRALVRCVENIAQTAWGYNRMYLHVDEDNAAALSLYKSEGYRDVGHRWNPFWAGSASDIGYYVKTIKPTTNR